jgi:hypothetical protein
MQFITVFCNVHIELENIVWKRFFLGSLQVGRYALSLSLSAVCAVLLDKVIINVKRIT